MLPWPAFTEHFLNRRIRWVAPISDSPSNGCCGTLTEMPPSVTQALLDSLRKPRPCAALRGSHVVFWLQRDLQDLGVAHNLLIAGGGNGLARDSVYLVEGMWLKDPLISRPNEDLKAQGLVLHVAMELREEKTKSFFLSSYFFGGAGRQPAPV